MPANQTELKKRLLGAADELRGNSNLKASWYSYSVQVPGLMFLIAICVLILASGRGGSAVERISAISVQRSGCYGFCPSYSITIHEDGRVEYEGKQYVERIGRYTTRISPLEFKRLSRMLSELGFFRLEERYHAGFVDGNHDFDPGVVDGDHVTVVVRGLNSTKVVRASVFHQAPIELWSIVVLVDGVAANIEWQKLESSSQVGQMGTRGR